MKHTRESIDLTYSELVSLINASGLTIGQSYKITDYQTVHYIIDGNSGSVVLEGGTGDSVINTGTVEPLLVTPVSTSGLSTVAYSTKHPQDIIYYDWNPNNWLFDLGISSDAEEVVSGFKGTIFYREDTKNKNIFGYDFRNVACRRWKLNQTAYPIWTGTTEYDLGDKVQVLDDGAYMSIVNGNSGNAVSLSSYWAKIIDYTNTDYWCLNSSDAADINDYEDSYTFDTAGGEYEDCVFQNIFTPTKDDTNASFSDTTSIFDNNVFVLTDQGEPSLYDNNIGRYSRCNTIDGNAFSNNTIGNSFVENIIGNTFSNNIIGNECTNNIMGNAITSNVIGNGFSGNNIGSNLNNNVIGNAFSSNTIGKNITGNNIGYYFNNNLATTNFNYNSIGNYFYANVEIGNYFEKNIIGNYFTGNDAIGNAFSTNIIGNGFNSNTIGSGFTNNFIANSFVSCVIDNDFHNNTSKDDISSVNFASVSHVYQDYNCEFLSASGDTQIITYFDGSNVLTVESLPGLK